MKKAIIFLGILTFIYSNLNYSYAVQVKSSDFEIIQDSQNINTNSDTNSKLNNIEVISETTNAEIILKNGKYGILNKNTNSFILNPIADSITPFNTENKNEYKIKINNLTGYANIEEGISFITNNDDLSLFDKYLKIKKDGKYGLIDKKGKTILMPQYQRINIIHNQGNEYITGKYEGKFKLFYNTGNLIPENELYVISKEDVTGIVRPIMPEIKRTVNSNQTTYELINPSKSEDNIVYEIEELPIPGTVKVGAIKKDIIKSDLNPLDYKIDNKNIFTIENKEYTLVKKDGKYGINNNKNIEILPPVFDSIVIKKLCKHFSTPVFIATKNSVKSIYNLKGILLAEEVYDKVNIYNNGNVYNYIKENNQWILIEKNKRIGILTQNKDSYNFEKTSFSFFNPHKVNELLISILEIN